MKTYLPKVDLEKRKWHVIDADGAVLGPADGHHDPAGRVTRLTLDVDQFAGSARHESATRTKAPPLSAGPPAGASRTRSAAPNSVHSANDW